MDSHAKKKVLALRIICLSTIDGTNIGPDNHHVLGDAPKLQQCKTEDSPIIKKSIILEKRKMSCHPKPL